ncbi:unnamed protein product [Sphagnum balticum]
MSESKRSLVAAGAVGGGIHTEEALLFAGAYDSPPPQDDDKEDYMNVPAGSVGDVYHDRLSNSLVISETTNGHGGTKQQMHGAAIFLGPSYPARSMAMAVEYDHYSQHQQRKAFEQFASHRLQRTTRRIPAVKRHAPAYPVARRAVSPDPTPNQQDEFVIGRRSLLLRKMRADAELAEAELVYRRELHELQVKKVKLEIERILEK